MSGRAVPWGVDVAVSALSPQRVAAEQAPALPPLYLASPTSAQAGWRLTPPLNKLVPGHFQPLLWPPIRISLIGQCVQLPYKLRQRFARFLPTSLQSVLPLEVVSFWRIVLLQLFFKMVTFTKPSCLITRKGPSSSKDTNTQARFSAGISASLK